MNDKLNLESRMLQFRLLDLPGQPKMMHMGTLDLMNDLWSEVQRLKKKVQILQDEDVELETQCGCEYDEKGKLERVCLDHWRFFYRSVDKGSAPKRQDLPMELNHESST